MGKTEGLTTVALPRMTRYIVRDLCVMIDPGRPPNVIVYSTQIRKKLLKQLN